jgi:hydrogenase expression/formation protein HypD
MKNPLLAEIEAMAKDMGEVRIMEVCGGHTNTVMRFGLRDVLPSNVRLISGPGCPVCVTSQHDIDRWWSLRFREFRWRRTGI